MKQVQWYVLHTAPRIERDIRQRLDAEPEVWETFLPMRKSFVTLAGKRLTRYTPLIPGYLFVRTDLGFLRRNLSDRYPQCYLQLDALRQAGHPMVISDAEMERFKFFTEQTDGQLTLLHSPYSQFHNNDRVRILTGPFAGYEGFIREIKRDNKLIFKVGNMAIAVSNIMRYDVSVISNAVPAGQTVLVRHLVDILLGRLQFLGFPDEAPQVLRDTLKYIGTERTLEDWLKALTEKGATRRLQAFRNFESNDAAYFLTLARYYYGKEPKTTLLHEIPDSVLRPFLTQTVGDEQLSPLSPVAHTAWKGKLQCASASLQPSAPSPQQSAASSSASEQKETGDSSAEQQVVEPLSSVSVSAHPLSEPLTLLTHAHFTEALCPIGFDENRYQSDTDHSEVEPHRYVAHVGMTKLPDGRYLYFSNWNEFYSHYQVLPHEERVKLLDKLEKYQLTAFHSALEGESLTTALSPEIHLGPVPQFDFSGFYMIFPANTLGEVLTTNPYHFELLQNYLTQSLHLIIEIMQSSRLRAWQTYLRTVWLRG